MKVEGVDEFVPDKNDEAKDKCTDGTARFQMSNLCKKWFKENCGTF